MRTRKMTWTTLLLFTALLAPAFAGADDARHLRSAPGAAKIAPDLLAKLEQDADRVARTGGELGSFRVVVNLERGPGAASTAAAFDGGAREQALRADVRAVQERVTSAVTGRAAAGFAVWNLYRSSYAFSAYADARGVAALAEHADVASIVELPIYYKTDSQAHALTNTDDAHAAGFDGDGVTIAIIDSAIDHDHPAFGGFSSFPNSKILGGFDFADNDSDPTIDCSAQTHGTAVAGVAAGDGGGIVGSARDANIVFLKIQGAGLCGQPALDGDIPGAIDWAVTNRNNFNPAIKVISMSFGNPSVNTNSPCTAIAEDGPLDAAAAAGMISVVASGNEAGKSGISSPACHPNAVSVGAVYDANVGGRFFGACSDPSTFADLVTCYSNSGTILDILAPSDCATTAATGGGTNTCFNGTSSATPYAAGVFATLFDKDSGLSRTDAINAVVNTGVNVTDPANGITKPRVNTMAALDSLDGGGGPGPCAGCVDFSTTTTVSYSNQDNTGVGSVVVQDGGATLALTGNRWRRTTQTYTLTANTVVEFDFMSTSQGEIHGLGFDEDDTLTNDVRIFQLFGTQNWSGADQTFDNYTTGDLGTFKTYTIPVGQFYTGSGFRLVLVNDKDSGTQNNTSSFRNVRIFEDTGGGGTCVVDDDFSGGAAGWSNSGASTCSTGAYVLNTPTQQSNSGVITQVGGDHTTGSGNAIFTATNTSAGNADVDGGNCILDSPTWSVSDASTLEVWYFHGQRDTGDDPGDDFFSLEVSTNGGASYTPFVSIGDVRTQAAWTLGSVAIPAGSNVRLRLQVSDGSGPGDLIEGGIDDLSICSN